MDRDALRRLLGTLQPRRNAGVYAFVTVSGDFDAVALQPLASFREPEDTTLVVEEFAPARRVWRSSFAPPG